MAPIEIYTPQETMPARRAVEELASHLPEPIVLAGGWGVWATVTERFELEHGTPYFGSRDADYGFTIDPDWTINELRNSTYAKALARIESLGYQSSGTTRYCRWLHRDTGKNLTEEEAKRIPTHDLVQLFVDPMVDVIHPQHAQVFKIKPLDSPLLRPVFTALDHRTELDVFGPRIWIPHPATLLAMKFESFPARNKDDKATKDLCDAYTVAWHSRIPFHDLVKTTRTRYPNHAAKARHMTQSPFLADASRHLGVGKNVIARVLREFHT